MNTQDLNLTGLQSMDQKADSVEVEAENGPALEDEVSHKAFELMGNIEEYEHGFLSGWAMEVGNPDTPIKIKVFENNQVIGEAIADCYREDIKSLGIGSGSHGFRIKLENTALDGEKHTVQVVDDESSTLLGNFTFVAGVFATAKIDSIEAGAVSGKLYLTEASSVSGFDMELLADGEVCATGVCALVDENVYSFRIGIPAELHDGNYHIFSTQLKSLSTKTNFMHERLLSNQTPWKYLSNDITASSLSCMSKIAGYRYEALQARLREAVTHENLENLIQAHDVLVEGYEDRKKFPKLAFPKVENPEVSIVIPTYNNSALTFNCLAAIILASPEPNYEVIVVDDCPTDTSNSLSDNVENLTVLKNTENLGFLKSSNLGAGAASGEFIVMLNNDTEVTHGWMEKLRYVFEKFVDVGMVGSKLIYPDGRLQEAGGIVWGNGKPWNIGNRMNPDDPVFSYTRQADYLSGAAFMIKKDVWNEVGQFSREFIPAYYEDTDLAFKVRDAGYKTFLCAESVVVHFEGMSNGTDLTSGVKKHQVINAPKFRAKWRKAYRHNGTEGQKLHIEKDRNVDFRVLMIDFSTPRPDQDAGGYAATQEMSLLQELGCKVTFLPNNMAHMGAYTHELQRQGVECIYAPFHQSSVEFIKARGKEFDLVYITRYDVAEDVLASIRKYSNAKIVLNNADLHFLRELRAALAAKTNSIEEPLATRERELNVMRSVDAVLSYNDVEHSVIASHNMESENIFKCPWVLTKKHRENDFNDRDGIAFLGGYNHLPNREAVSYFVENVMPGLSERIPDVKFHIYGSKITKEIEQLESDNVIIKGYVKSLSDVFDNCRVFVAPLLSGAGIKGKVLESISYGVPCVLSPIAAESTGLVHELSTLIANSDEKWVDYIEKLYTDEALWNQMSQSSGLLVDELYSFSHGLGEMSKMMSYLELDPSIQSQKLLQK